MRREAECGCAGGVCRREAFPSWSIRVVQPRVFPVILITLFHVRIWYANQQRGHTKVGITISRLHNLYAPTEFRHLHKSNRMREL